ncbi:DNA glycosylase superfamily protein isoform X1 [Tasmannia lanceolata]|uniref:DNA glycosylase superfamily protein isoform X1 n=1 Tax=Tasmannia lanceolata TaxID=3420 RepID=UPI0040640886
MSNARVLLSLTEPESKTLPPGNRARVSELPESICKKTLAKNPQRRSSNRLLKSIVRCNVSADGSCSSDSSANVSSMKKPNFRRPRMLNGVKKSVKIVPDGIDLSTLPESVLEKRRCGWITPKSDPLYASFHNEEWGVPVHDDRKLFELLVLSEALGELSWPTILNKRDTFRISSYIFRFNISFISISVFLLVWLLDLFGRRLFDNFDAASIAKFTEKKILLLKASGSTLLSEPKLRAVVENARQTLKVVEEFGSFSNYCWSFVNHKPIVNGFRYARQVPVKTPKAEAMSKDMMRRGFRCVGPTVIYSFMQTAGIVNDHLSSCFRYKECNSNFKDCESKVEEMKALVKAVEKTCLLLA